MSSLYDHPPVHKEDVLVNEPGLNLDNAIGLPAGITVQTGSFDGKRWFALQQAGQSIAVTYEELEPLVLGLAGIWKDYKPDPAPEQLRLFDPDNPPEAPDEHRVDTAQ